ncbi:MAG: glycosyltransferase family 2 protein [Flavobacteriaceae bacterium]|nr:glycosyltransferase family 2 protein [Flavobacteriaceae bacterium]
MQASILIVSKNRKQALKFTLQALERIVDLSNNEVLVFLDGCTDESALLKNEFGWVKWFFVEKSMGASAARNQLYPKAKGHYLIGLDDDAHPLFTDFIARTIAVFDKYPNAGILAFEEIKGVFKSDQDVLKSVDSKIIEYQTNDFIGCGFAIRKDIYEQTNGFPVWMDIYGEESCVSIEVMSKGYDIIFTNTIKVNHRIDKEVRKRSGKNYFRFERQLKNTTSYYLVYYKNPIIKIIKLYGHNFRKYAMTDFICFKLFFKVILEVVLNIPKIIKYRNPISEAIIEKKNKLRPIKY